MVMRRRSSRIAAIVVAIVMALPAAGVANHTTCPDESGPCPVFEPDLQVDLSASFANSPSTLTMRWAETDHTAPIVDVQYLLPRGWRFAVNTIRPAEKTAGGAATSCGDVFTGLNSHRDLQAARLQKAENLAGAIGMTANIDINRNNTERNRSIPGSVRFGTVRDNGPALAFLNWDPSARVAKMCMYLWAFDWRLDHSDTQTDLCNERGSGTETNVVRPAPNDTDDPLCELGRQHLVEVTLEEIDDPQFGWRVHYDLSSFYKNKHLFDQRFSPLSSTFYFNVLSGGNWNRNPVTNQLQPVVFSRTPQAAGRYPFRAVLSTCAQGMVAPPSASVCRNGAMFTRTLEQSIDITQPPSAIIHDFAKLTGPAGPAPLPAGYAIRRNTSTVPVTWTQVANAAERVKAYAVTIAPSGDQDGRVQQYLAIDPSSPVFDPREPCGPDGAAASCSLTLNFPMSGIGGSILTGDGVYDIVLVTVYADGHRSDGLCDDGTVSGSPCDPTTQDVRTIAPGASKIQLVMSADPWPDTYIENQRFVKPGVSDKDPTRTYQAPASVLLVDFAAQRARFIVARVNPQCSGGTCLATRTRPQVYEATSRGIVGANGTGVVSFETLDPEGRLVRFDAVIFPPGSGPPHIADPTFLAVTNPEARGTFIVVDDKGLPNPPSGMPTVFFEPFEGQRILG